MRSPVDYTEITGHPRIDKSTSIQHTTIHPN